MDEHLLKHDDKLGIQSRKSSGGLGTMMYELNSIGTSRVLLSEPGHGRDPTPELTTYGNIKLGWIQGVLIPCLLNIWGVMLFLRIAWIVAQAGLALSLVIIFISAIVCVITTLSLSAICTNGELQGGGVYFLVSRSLGAELGASVGIIFAFANAVAASMNTIGFCDSLNELLKSHNLKIIDNGPNDTRIVGTIALIVMCFICAVGMDWETKAQNFLIVIIISAIINFILGAAIGPSTDHERARGFAGLSTEVWDANWLPDYRFSEGEHHNFFSVFSIYFPAVTGVQAGANICGDLKDPATAIPRGTLTALAISVTSYVIMTVLSGMGAQRDASGNPRDLHNNTLQNCIPKCDYGLHNNYEIMQMMALWGPLIYVGCWAATLSTALTNLLSVPRLIQALGFDRIYPGLIFFSKRYGKHGEPYRGYVLVFLVSFVFVQIADLNTIAPLISNFYLASYALINFCTFHAAFFKPISWRPDFRFYNTWLSLAGCVLCLVIMMVISWVMALLTTFVFITLYLIVLYRKPEISWGSSTEAQRYQETIASIVHIYHRTASTKSYNPQLLIFGGTPDDRPWLTDLGHLITKIGSFMILADIENIQLTQRERHTRRRAGEEWLRERKMRAFYLLLHACTYEQGCQALLQATGLGRIAPNVVLLGFKYDWDTCTHPELLTYYRMIRPGDDFCAVFLDQTSMLDAWWMYDDGGINILLPYIIARRGCKENMMLRIFALPQESIPIKEAEEHMAGLLHKFRIHYSQLTMITSIKDRPDDSTWAFFNDVMKHHRSATDDNDEILTSDKEYERLRHKTCRTLRIRELLVENSFGADFIVMTLPLPRQGISAAMYMAWLKVMSEGMPPILFVRGNSTVVIE